MTTDWPNPSRTGAAARLARPHADQRENFLYFKPGSRSAFRQQRLGQFEGTIRTLEKRIVDKVLADELRTPGLAFSLSRMNLLPAGIRCSRPETLNERLYGQQQSFAAEGTPHPCAAAHSREAGSRDC